MHGYLPQSRIRVLIATSASGTSLRLSATATSQLVSCQSSLLSTTNLINKAVEQFTLPDLSHGNRLVELDRFEQLDSYTQQPCCSIQEISEHESKLGGEDGSSQA